MLFKQLLKLDLHTLVLPLALLVVTLHRVVLLFEKLIAKAELFNFLFEGHY